MAANSERTKTCQPNSSCLATISDDSIQPDGGSPEFRPLLRHGRKLLGSRGRLDNGYNQKIFKFVVAPTIERPCQKPWGEFCIFMQDEEYGCAGPAT